MDPAIAMFLVCRAHTMLVLHKLGKVSVDEYCEAYNAACPAFELLTDRNYQEGDLKDLFPAEFLKELDITDL
jgi:hypothetical protein